MLQSSRHSSHVSTTNDESVCLPLPSKSESHATRYRTSPNGGDIIVLLAPGQILEGRGTSADVDADEVVLVDVNVGVDDVGVDSGGDEEIADPGSARLVDASRSLAISVPCLAPND